MEDFQKGYFIFNNLLGKDKCTDMVSWLEKNKGLLNASNLEGITDYNFINHTKLKEPLSPFLDFIKNMPQNFKNFLCMYFSEDFEISSFKVNYKDAWVGSTEFYHQELIYQEDKEMLNNMLACFIPLEEHTINNGCLRVIPYSHQNGLLKHHNFVHINGNHKYCVDPECLDKQSKKNNIFNFEANAGNAIIFHPLLIHGSSSNVSSNNRKALVIHFKRKSYIKKNSSSINRYIYELSNLNMKINKSIEKIKNNNEINLKY